MDNLRPPLLVSRIRCYTKGMTRPYHKTLPKITTDLCINCYPQDNEWYCPHPQYTHKADSLQNAYDDIESAMLIA